jgi:hypothetical protein
VRRTLDELVAKQVLGRDDDPRLADAGQYHFLQAFLRTIALGRLPRHHRKASHLAAANHLRSARGDAPETAEILASHYLDAVAADPDATDPDAIRSLARETSPPPAVARARWQWPPRRGAISSARPTSPAMGGAGRAPRGRLARRASCRRHGARGGCSPT